MSQSIRVSVKRIRKTDVGCREKYVKRKKKSSRNEKEYQKEEKEQKKKKENSTNAYVLYKRVKKK